MERALREDPLRCWVKCIDAKPLPIGGYSKDPDARWGRATSAQAKGYKLYAIVGFSSLPLTWRLKPMNVNENKVALELVPQLSGEGYLLGDSEYDSNSVHDVTTATHHQLVTPRRYPGTQIGHRRQSPGRVRSMELIKKPFGHALLNYRKPMRCRSFSGVSGRPRETPTFELFARRSSRIQRRTVSAGIYSPAN